MSFVSTSRPPAPGASGIATQITRGLKDREEANWDGEITPGHGKSAEVTARQRNVELS